MGSELFVIILKKDNSPRLPLGPGGGRLADRFKYLINRETHADYRGPFLPRDLRGKKLVNRSAINPIDMPV
jgi:hypothetical protein